MGIINWFKGWGSAIKIVNALDGAIKQFPIIDSKKIDTLLQTKPSWVDKDVESISKQIINGFDKKISADNVESLGQKYLDFYKTIFPEKDIQSGIDKTNVAIQNGTATKSSVNILKAELLKANQRTIELKATRKGYAEMLSHFIGTAIDENTTLLKPAPQLVSNTINRPELKFYDLQKKTFDLQNKLITAKNLPRFSLFFQGGLGRPALNMLSNDVQGYYIGGLRLNWNLTGFYTYNKEKKILAVNQDFIDIQRETFLFNTNLNLRQQNSEITKVQELIETDSDIISLRESVKNTTKIQLENGTATTNDYLISVNAEDQARQNLILHEIQLLMAQYNYQTMSGN